MSYFSKYKLSGLQRALLIPYFSAQSLLQPTRGEFIAGLGDVTSSRETLRTLKKKILLTPNGQKLFEDKPIITESSLNYPFLRTLPDNTLGREYVRFMDEHGFSADERSKVNFHVDPDEAYLIARYRQIHDFWHVLSGLPISIFGELALKSLEYHATGLPVAKLGSTFGQLRLSMRERDELNRVFLPWGRNTGIKCGPSLIAYRYENNLDKDLDLVRQELGFVKAPLIPQYLLDNESKP